MKPKDITQEYMKPNVDFIAKYADLLPNDGGAAKLKKMVDNFDVAWKGVKDSDEMKTYLNIIYATNARSLASELLNHDVLTPEILEEVNNLPRREDAQALVQPFIDATESKRKSIMAEQMAFAEHNKEIEVLKGIAFGDSPTKAKKAVENYDKKQAQALGMPQ